MLEAKTVQKMKVKIELFVFSNLCVVKLKIPVASVKLQHSESGLNRKQSLPLVNGGFKMQRDGKERH